MSINTGAGRCQEEVGYIVRYLTCVAKHLCWRKRWHIVETALLAGLLVGNLLSLSGLVDWLWLTAAVFLLPALVMAACQRASPPAAAYLLDRHYQFDDILASAWYCQEQGRQERFPTLFANACNCLRQLSDEPRRLPLPRRRFRYSLAIAVFLTTTAMYFQWTSDHPQASQPPPAATVDDIVATLQQAAAALVRAQEKPMAMALADLGAQVEKQSLPSQLTAWMARLSDIASTLAQQRPSYFLQTMSPNDLPLSATDHAADWEKRLQKLSPEQHEQIRQWVQEKNRRDAPESDRQQAGRLRDMERDYGERAAHIRHAQNLLATLLRNWGGKTAQPPALVGDTSVAQATSENRNSPALSEQAPRSRQPQNLAHESSDMAVAVVGQARRSNWKKGWWPATYQRLVDRYFAEE